MIYEVRLPGLDLQHTDPTRRTISAGQELDDLDHDLWQVRNASKLTVTLTGCLLRIAEFLFGWKNI